MRIIRNIIALLLILIQNNIYASDNVKYNILNSIENFTKDHRIQAIYAIAEKGKTIVTGAQGYYDLEQNKRLTISQIMPIVSITKQVTAAGILLLQDRGLLSTNDVVSKHLPLSCGIWKVKSLPEWAHKVTIHNLLTHSSGLSEYIFSSQINDDTIAPDAIKNIIKFASETPTEFEAGTKYKYNNTGYVVLGAIIEQLSHQNLGDFFKKEFFDPLSMKHTWLLTISDAIQIQKNLSDEYPVRYYATPSSTTPKFTPVVMTISAAPYADGGLVSNVEDLIKWNEALHHGKILSKISYHQMIHPYFKADDQETGYASRAGYGIFISRLHNGKIYYHHAGAAFGARVDTGYIPQNDISIAIISNVMLNVPLEAKNKVDFRKPENQIDISYFRDALLESL